MRQRIHIADLEIMSESVCSLLLSYPSDYIGSLTEQMAVSYLNVFCVIRIWFSERIHAQAHTSIKNSLKRFNTKSLTFWQYHFHMDSRIEGRDMCFATKIGYSFALSPH